MPKKVMIDPGYKILRDSKELQLCRPDVAGETT